MVRIPGKALVWILAPTTVGCDHVTKNVASAWLADNPAMMSGLLIVAGTRERESTETPNA